MIILKTMYSIDIKGLMKQKIQTDQAPRAIGPYSQGIRAGDLVYISGQIPIEPSSGEIESQDISHQTRLVLSHIEAILASEGLTMDHVVKTEIFLTSMEDFKTMNEVYASFFKHEPLPARQAIEAAKLPRGSKIEISCIAHI